METFTLSPLTPEYLAAALDNVTICTDGSYAENCFPDLYPSYSAITRARGIDRYCDAALPDEPNYHHVYPDTMMPFEKPRRDWGKMRVTDPVIVAPAHAILTAEDLAEIDDPTVRLTIESSFAARDVPKGWRDAVYVFTCLKRPMEWRGIIAIRYSTRVEGNNIVLVQNPLAIYVRPQHRKKSFAKMMAYTAARDLSEAMSAAIQAPDRERHGVRSAYVSQVTPSKERLIEESAKLLDAYHAGASFAVANHGGDNLELDADEDECCVDGIPHDDIQYEGKYHDHPLLLNGHGFTPSEFGRLLKSYMDSLSERLLWSLIVIPIVGDSDHEPLHSVRVAGKSVVLRYGLQGQWGLTIYPEEIRFIRPQGYMFPFYSDGELGVVFMGPRSRFNKSFQDFHRSLAFR